MFTMMRPSFISKIENNFIFHYLFQLYFIKYDRSQPVTEFTSNVVEVNEVSDAGDCGGKDHEQPSLLLKLKISFSSPVFISNNALFFEYYQKILH